MECASTPPSTSFPLEKETSLEFTLCMGFIHTTEQAAREGDNSHSPPGTPSTIYVGCVGGTESSLAAAAFLGLCLGPLFTFAHTVLGTLLTSCGAAGAAACR